jgi:hypothetical protein
LLFQHYVIWVLGGALQQMLPQFGAVIQEVFGFFAEFSYIHEVL